MPNPEHRGQPPIQHNPTNDREYEREYQDKGQPASTTSPEDVGHYMADLGAGTGVDIGPGAAGEMGGAAQSPDENREEIPKKASHQDDLEFPDSGDLPHILPGHHDSP